MMKKIIHALLALLLSIPIVMAQGKEVKITSVNDATPGEVAVTIQMLNLGSNVSSVDLRILYDKNLLQFSDEEFHVSGNGVIGALDPGVVNIGFFNTNGVTIEGNFMTLKFQYSGGFETSLVFDEDKTEIKLLNADIEIDTHTPGNIIPTFDDKDGTINIASATAVPGSAVSIPLTITDDGGFGQVNAMTLYVKYDQAKLSYSPPTAGNLTFNSIDHDSATGIITLEYFGDPLTFNGSPPEAINLNFTYLGGGFADVEFLPGSVAEFVGDNGEILITRFEHGGVGLATNVPGGTLSIEKVITAGAEVLSNPNGLDPNDPGFDGAIEPDPVEVRVFADGLDELGLNQLSLNISYDTNLLEYTGHTIGTVPSWTTIAHDAVNGTLNFTRISATDFSLDEALLTLKFNYLYVDPDDDEVDYSDSQADITFLPNTILESIGSDIELYMPKLEDGWVRLVLPGDITGNGDATDVTNILKLINHLFEPFDPLPFPENADINGDGELDLQDLLLLINIVFPPE